MTISEPCLCRRGTPPNTGPKL